MIITYYPIISKNTVSKNKIYNLHSDYSGINIAKKVIAEGIADSFWRIQRNCSTVKGLTRFYSCRGSRKCPKTIKLVLKLKYISLNSIEHAGKIQLVPAENDTKHLNAST